MKFTFLVLCGLFAEMAIAEPLVRNAVVTVSVGLPETFLQYTRQRAVSDASAEIADNKMFLYKHDYPHEYDGKIVDRVLEKYHLHRYFKGGCMPVLGEEEYADVHDEVIRGEIQRRHGDGFWLKIDQEIQAEIKNRKLR